MDPLPSPKGKKRKDYSVGNVCFSNDYEIDLIQMRNLMQRKYLAESRETEVCPLNNVLFPQFDTLF